MGGLVGCCVLRVLLVVAATSSYGNTSPWMTGSLLWPPCSPPCGHACPTMDTHGLVKRGKWFPLWRLGRGGSCEIVALACSSSSRWLCCSNHCHVLSGRPWLMANVCDMLQLWVATSQVVVFFFSIRSVFLSFSSLYRPLWGCIPAFFSVLAV